MLEEDKPEECESCGHTSVRLKSYQREGMRGFNNPDPKWLCDLCAGSLAGRAVDYPNQFDGKVLGAICYVGNVILERISELERK